MIPRLTEPGGHFLQIAAINKGKQPLNNPAEKRSGLSGQLETDTILEKKDGVGLRI